MPGFDGTGPQGRGPRTGGGFGFCGVPTARRNVAGYGLGRGGRPWGGGRGRCWGGRRGYGRGWQPNVTTAAPANEEAYLKEQLQALQQEMDQIQQRMRTLAQGK